VTPVVGCEVEALSHEVSKKNLRWKLARIRSAKEGIESIDYGGVLMPKPGKPSWRNFDYAELVAASLPQFHTTTDNFKLSVLVRKNIFGSSSIFLFLFLFLCI
jgi:hypothetical protein